MRTEEEIKIEIDRFRKMFEDIEEGATYTKANLSGAIMALEWVLK